MISLFFSLSLSISPSLYVCVYVCACMTEKLLKRQTIMYIPYVAYVVMGIHLCMTHIYLQYESWEKSSYHQNSKTISFD